MKVIINFKSLCFSSIVVYLELDGILSLTRFVCFSMTLNYEAVQLFGVIYVAFCVHPLVTCMQLYKERRHLKVTRGSSS